MLVFYFMLAMIMLLSIYLWYRLAHLAPKGLLRKLTKIAGVFFTLAWPFTIVSTRFFPNVIPNPVEAILSEWGAGWIIMMVYVLLLTICWDLFRICNHFTGWIHPRTLKSWIGKEGNLGVFILVAGCMIGLTLYGNHQYHQKKRVEYSVITEKDLTETYTIVALSDLHLGHLVKTDELAEWVDLINQENPDFVLLLGDIIDHSLHSIDFNAIKAEFDRIESRFGVYGVLGNHEYIESRTANIAFLQALGIQLLIDEGTIINDELYLIGRDDRTHYERHRLEELLPDHIDKPIIVMDHQPFGVEEVAKHPITLQLSGHTHRGQIWPYSWLTEKIYHLTHGMETINNSTFIVSSGIGIWGAKIRIGTESEYLVIRLKSDKPPI